MSYTPALDVVQVGDQVSFGTGVTTTAKLSLIEECEIEPIQEAEAISELRGGLAGKYTATLNKGGGKAKLAGALCYEDLGYYLDSILAKNTSPTGANPYVYLREPAINAVPTRRIMSILKGQSNYDYRLIGAVAQEMNVKIESNKPWMFDANFVGYKVDEAGVIQSLNDRTATMVHANNTSIYIDAWDGTIGTTLISSAWFSAELKIKSNVEVVPTIGNLYPASYRDAPYEGELKMRLEVDATTKAFVTSILGTSVAQKQIRIKATTGASAIAQFDFAGTFKNAPMVDDENGVSVFEFEMFHTYNPTLANWLKTSVTTTVSALP